MGTTDSKAVLVADVVRMKAASLSDHDCESFDRLLELPVGVMVRVHAVCVCVTCAAPRSIPQCCAAGAVAPISAVGFSYSPSPPPPSASSFLPRAPTVQDIFALLQPDDIRFLRLFQPRNLGRLVHHVRGCMWLVLCVCPPPLSLT